MKIYASIDHEFNLVDRFKANKYMSNAIIGIREIWIYINNYSNLIVSNTVIISQCVRQRYYLIQHKILLAIITTLPLHSEVLILIYYFLLFNNQIFFI